MGTYSRSADRLPIAGPPNEKFAIQSYTAHIFRPNKTEFITPPLAITLILSRVHSLRAGEASTRSPPDVRVGADAGVGAQGRAGRRGALDRKTRGGHRRAPPSRPYDLDLSRRRHSSDNKG